MKVTIPWKVAAISAIARDAGIALQPRRKTQGRLFDPMRRDGTFPFEYTNHANTNVAATIERVKRELANGERKL